MLQTDGRTEGVHPLLDLPIITEHTAASGAGWSGLMLFDHIFCPNTVHIAHVIMLCTRRSRGEIGGQDPPPPLKITKYRVSLQYWSRSPKSHKATKPAFNVGQSPERR